MDGFEFAEHIHEEIEKLLSAWKNQARIYRSVQENFQCGNATIEKAKAAAVAFDQCVSDLQAAVKRAYGVEIDNTEDQS